jgi:hypothetical protein
MLLCCNSAFALCAKPSSSIIKTFLNYVQTEAPYSVGLGKCQRKQMGFPPGYLSQQALPKSQKIMLQSWLLGEEPWSGYREGWGSRKNLNQISNIGWMSTVCQTHLQNSEKHECNFQPKSSRRVLWIHTLIKQLHAQKKKLLCSQSFLFDLIT